MEHFHDISLDSFETLESANSGGSVLSVPRHGEASAFSASGYDVLNNAGNILAEILTDEQFSTLRRLGLLNEKALRDFHIRKVFKELRNQHLSAHHAIERLQSMYSYLQFDTLRKIVYQINEREK